MRLMAPFSMKCTQCGEFIYKGRKFNARKETTDDKYYSIAIYRFYIRCTRCSAEITFKTDPKNMDYECEKGAKRNFEPWRTQGGKEESEEERLDRLEQEEEERGAMKELEMKVVDAKREMKIADALDEIRTRNARNERVEKGGIEGSGGEKDDASDRIEMEMEEMARRAFMTDTGDRVRRLGEEDEGEVMAGPSLVDGESEQKDALAMPPPTFKRAVKKKKDFSAALGIKRKPALV